MAGQSQPLRPLRPLRVGPPDGPHSPAAHARRHRPDRLARRPHRHDGGRHDLPAPVGPSPALHRRAPPHRRRAPRVPGRTRRPLDPLRHRHRRLCRRRQVNGRAPPPAAALPLGLHAARGPGDHRRLPLPEPDPAGTIPHRPQGVSRVLRPLGPHFVPRLGEGRQPARKSPGVLARHLRHRARHLR